MLLYHMLLLISCRSWSDMWWSALQAFAVTAATLSFAGFALVLALTAQVVLEVMHHISPLHVVSRRQAVCMIMKAGLFSACLPCTGMVLRFLC